MDRNMGPAEITRQNGFNYPHGANTWANDYKVMFPCGIELEITNCRDEGLAKVLCIDHLRATGRPAMAVGNIRAEKIPRRRRDREVPPSGRRRDRNRARSPQI
jgi:hypothetical protein